MINRISNNLGSLDVSSISDDVTSLQSDVASLESKTDITSSFPSSLDAGVIDPISKLQSKVGVDGSLDSSSLEYRISGLQGNFVQPQLTSVATVSSITGYGFGNDNPLRRYCSKNNTSLPTWQRHFDLWNGHSSVRKPSGTLRRFMREAVVDSNTKLWRSGGTDGNICWFNPTGGSADYSDIIYLGYNSGDKSSNYTTTISSTVDYFVDPQPYTEITLSTSPSVSTDGVKIGEYYFKVNKTCMFDGNKLYLDGDYSSLIESGETVYTAQYSNEDKQLRSGTVMHFPSGKWIDAGRYWEPLETRFALQYPQGSSAPLASTFYGNVVALGEHLIVVPDEWNDWYVEVEMDADAVVQTNAYNRMYYYYQWATYTFTDPNDDDYWWWGTMPALAGTYKDVYDKHSLFANGRETLGATDARYYNILDTANFPQTSSYANFSSATPGGSIYTYNMSTYRLESSTQERNLHGKWILGNELYSGTVKKQRFITVAPFIQMPSSYTYQRIFCAEAVVRAVRLS